MNHYPSMLLHFLPYLNLLMPLVVYPSDIANTPLKVPDINSVCLVDPLDKRYTSASHIVCPRVQQCVASRHQFVGERKQYI